MAMRSRKTTIMPKTKDTYDPIGLIKESYAIYGITKEQCRSIFLDWALKVPYDASTAEYAKKLYDLYAAQFPDHAMTDLLKSAKEALETKKHRKGRRARLSYTKPNE